MPLPPQPTKAYVSLSELAEDILGLSRARVYELIERGALPHPIYDIRTRRPMFNAELIEQARTVRQTGVGSDGSAVVFYRRNRQPAVTVAATTRGRARSRASTPPSARHADLIASLQSLGVSHADEHSVTAAVAECFPNGIVGQQESDVLRAVFRILRRRDSA